MVGSSENIVVFRLLSVPPSECIVNMLSGGTHMFQQLKFALKYLKLTIQVPVLCVLLKLKK